MSTDTKDEEARKRCRQEWENVNDPPCHPGDADWKPCDLCTAPKDDASVFDISNDALRLMAGEMTAQEMRTVRAVLNGLRARAANARAAYAAANPLGGPAARFDGIADLIRAGDEVEFAMRVFEVQFIDKDNTRDAALERHEDAFQELKQWAQAYPLSVFPEPDFKKAHAILQEHGMTLDAISASNMRHVIKQVEAIIDRAAAAGEKP